MRKLSDWIEFMERASHVKSLEGLSMLLRHSRSDQLVLENLRRLRRILKTADPAETIEAAIADPEFLSSFHERTMAQITKNKTVPNTAGQTPKTASSRHAGRGVSRVSYKS